MSIDTASNTADEAASDGGFIYFDSDRNGEFPSRLAAMRIDEISWGVGQMIFGSIVALFGAVTTAALVMAIPQFGGAPFVAVPVAVAIAAGGGITVLVGWVNLKATRANGR